MPLLDHFHRPSSLDYPWRTLHGLWCGELMGLLNSSVLPEGYRAFATISLGAHAQVDVATVDQQGNQQRAEDGNGAGGIATTVWAPPKPSVVLRTSLPDLDGFEVEVLADELGGRIVAAVELVSPRNKDRPAARNAFAAKVAGYLQQGVGVIVVDVVTERHDNLHARLMDLLELPANPPGGFDLYAVAYRPVAEEERSRVEVWAEPLAIGASLPTLPLWIAADRAVPLDLEAGYSAALERFRVR